MGDNKSILGLGGEAQRDNDPHRLDYVRRDQYDAVISTRMNAQDMLATGAVVGAGALLIELALGGVKLATCWGVSKYDPTIACTLANGAFWTYTLAVPAAAACYSGVSIWSRIQRTRAEYLRARITRDRYSNPIDSLAVTRKTDEMSLRELLLATQAEIAMAPFKQYPAGLDALNISNSNTTKPELAAPQDVTAQALDVGPVPVETWLKWMDEVPHIMLAAETGGGKSVMASVIVDGRVRNRGDSVAILDPHWSPLVEADDGRLVPKWGGIKPMATNHRDIRRALIAIRAEYDHRMEQLHTGKVVEKHFPPLTIIIDETPEVVAELKKLDPKGVDTWASTTQVLGSGARKVNMSVILLTQSPLVEDVSLNGAMRKNFYRVALKHAEISFLLKDEKNIARREAVLQLVEGEKFPAAVIRDGKSWVLDRSNLLDLMPERIDAVAWTPDPFGDEGGCDECGDDDFLGNLLGTNGTSGTGSAIAGNTDKTGRITTPLGTGSAGSENENAVPGLQDAVPEDDAEFECVDVDKMTVVKILAEHTQMSANDIAKKAKVRKDTALRMIKMVRNDA